MKKILIISLMVLGPKWAFAGGSTSSSPFAVLVPSSINISSASAQSGGQASIVITTPTSAGAFSTGYFTYLTNIHIEQNALANLTGLTMPLACTSSGLNSAQWTFSTVSSSGAVSVTDIQYANPLQGTQASNVSITCPATTNVKWSINVGYYQGS